MPTPVLATKLLVPARRPELVARPRLTATLDATLDAGHRLTLLSAPAGFGKTTVLSDWIFLLARHHPHARVAWVALDDGDNDLPRLMAHVVASLHGAGLGIEPAVLEPLHTSSASDALTSFVNEVTGAGDGAPEQVWVLVLDDLHVVESPVVHEALAFLLGNLPPHLHLVMATRSDPPLPLARLRSHGQLTEVRAADLRFSAGEAQEFLNRVMGLRLDADAVDALESRTEGWIVGLQLAGLSLQGITEPAAVAGFIEAFTGSNRFVIDFLADEVLARQPQQVSDFLLRTAVLDRLTGPLCDAVTGGAGGTRMLEHLERGNLFLVPLDTERSWYRYHHLFADVLRARLRREAPESEPELHRRASEWFSTHALPVDAVRHALGASDVRRAAYLVEEAVPEMRRTRQDGVLLGWMRSLPESVVRSSPVLSIVSGWSALMAGDLDAVARRLDDAEEALAAGARDPALAATWADTEDRRTAPATVSVYRAALAQARGDVDGTVRHARRALDLAGAEDHAVRGAGSGFLGLAAWAAGDVDEALATFTEAVRSLHAAGNLVDELDTTVVMADMWVASGRPSRARGLCVRALRTAEGSGLPHVRAAADLHVTLAELDREVDDIAGAEAHLETARTLRERGSITENRHRWFVAMAQVRAATGDHGAATDLLDEAAALYRPGFYPDVHPIAAMRARVRIAAGDLAEAVRWADARRLGLDDDAEYLREHEHLTLARLVLAQHRAGAGSDRAGASLPALLGLLDRLRAAADAARRHGSTLEIGALQALAHHARGDLPAALAALGRSWAEAPEPDSHVRLYLDEGAPMTVLLSHGARAMEHRDGPVLGDGVQERCRRLLQRTRIVTGGASPTAVPDALSRRELEVLRLLATDLTGPEIARELYVSLNTLRTHTKRIFTKLDARTRAAAVRSARHRGLL